MQVARDFVRPVTCRFELRQGIFEEICIVRLERYTAAVGEERAEKRKERAACEPTFCVALFRPWVTEIYMNSFKTAGGENTVETRSVCVEKTTFYILPSAFAQPPER